MRGCPHVHADLRRDRRRLRRPPGHRLRRRRRVLLTLALVQPDAFGQEFRTSTTWVALQVDDVAATRAELESKGIEFQRDTIDSGVCHMAFLTDPDGNTLILHHRYAPKDASPPAAA